MIVRVATYVCDVSDESEDDGQNDAFCDNYLNEDEDARSDCMMVQQ